MGNITIPKKEYQELLRLREELNRILKRIRIKEKTPMRGEELLEFTRLKIKGGRKDLSEKTDYYLYGE